MGEAGSKEGEEVCVSDGVGWVGLVKVKLRRRMDVYDCRSEGEAVTTLETDKTCWKLQGRRCRRTPASGGAGARALRVCDQAR